MDSCRNRIPSSILSFSLTFFCPISTAWRVLKSSRPRWRMTLTSNFIVEVGRASRRKAKKRRRQTFECKLDLSFSKRAVLANDADALLLELDAAGWKERDRDGAAKQSKKKPCERERYKRLLSFFEENEEPVGQRRLSIFSSHSSCAPVALLRCSLFDSGPHHALFPPR